MTAQPQQHRDRDLFPLNLSETTASVRAALDKFTKESLPKLEKLVDKVTKTVDRVDRVIDQIEETAPKINATLDWMQIVFKVLTVFLILAALWMLVVLIQRLRAMQKEKT